MAQDKRLYLSTCAEPWYNQAFEEQLLVRVGPGQHFLYLWQNQRTVVLGRHQNAWKECCLQRLEQEGGFLARRISGGGAVYHDLGNLNFTFISKRSEHDVQAQLALVLQAVRSLGVEAVFSGRNDLEAAGRKFSGNAFCYRHDAALHHGTLLVSSDYRRLADYLSPAPAKLAANGVRSVPARVVNLQELAPHLTIPKMIDALRCCFAGDIYDEIDTRTAACPELYQKFSSREWRFGQTPPFSVSYCRRFDWGEVELLLAVKNGLIAAATCYSDALDGDLIAELAASLPGAALNEEAVAASWGKVAQTAKQKAVVNDLLVWIANIL